MNAGELTCLLARTRKFLDNERLEKERIRKLEDVRKDMDLRLSEDEISTLTNLIRMGDEKSLSGIEQIIGRVSMNANKNEPIRVAAFLKNSIYDITANLMKAFPYIELFIDPSIYRGFDDMTNQNRTTLHTLFMDKIKYLIHLIVTLRLDYQDKGIVKHVCNYILKNIDSNISLSMAAEQLYMNKTYISESFKQKIGISFTEYVTLVKMLRAQVLILKDDLKSYEIAEKLGYKDAEYFSKVFKKCIGITPTEFRQNRRNL